MEREQPREAALLVQHSTLDTTLAAQTLRSLLEQGQVVVLDTATGLDIASVPGSHKYVMSAGGWARVCDQIASHLREYHQRYPLRAGMPREELKSRLGLSPRAFSEAVSRATSQGTLMEAEALLSLADHRVVLTPDQQRRTGELLRAFQQNPYSPPTVAESEAMVGADVLAALIEQGKLVKVSDVVLFSAEAYEQMTRAVTDHLQHEGRITLAQVRDLFNTSRKYAQALLEHLDDQRVTRRVGDERVLR